MRLLPIALIVMLAGLASAEGTCGVVFSADSLSIFFLGMTISILFVAVWYLGGVFLHSPEIEATTQAEIQQIGITFLIAIMLGGALELLCSVQISKEGVMISDSTGGIFEQTRETYQKMIAATLDVYIDMSNSVMERAMLGSTFGGATVFYVTVTMAPYTANSMMATTIAPVAQSVLIAYFAQVFQYTLFTIAQTDVFLMVIPVGLCLRAFPITRKFGGTLLAVGIGLSIIFPLIVSFTYMLAGQISTTDLSIGNATYGYIAPFAAVMLALMIMGAIAGVTSFSALAISITGGVVGLGTMGLASGIDSAMLSNYFSQVYDAYGSIMMYAFFLPALQMLITAALVRSLAGALGSEIDISGIMRAI